MSLAVVQVCSDAYRDFLPRWAASVARLGTVPDDVVLVCQSSPPPLEVDCRVIVLERPFAFAEWMNEATAATECDWVAWTGADDAYRPWALDGVERDDADVVAFGLQYDTGQSWMPAAVTAAQVLEVRSNLVPCGSPFRRSLWERQPFNPAFGPLMDWAFYVGLAAHGARFAATGRIDVDYAYAGHTAPPDEPTRTDIRAWARTLEDR